MKIALVIIFIFSFNALISQELDRFEIREMYFDGWHNDCGAQELAELLEHNDVEHDPILIAYQGAALTTLANCKKSPFSKLSVFNDGKKLLEEAVSQNSENIEIRFLRYTVQTNLPDFLNYDNTEEDKKLMMESLTLQKLSVSDPDLYERMRDYLLSAGSLSKEEQRQLEQLTAGG